MRTLVIASLLCFASVPVFPQDNILDGNSLQEKCVSAQRLEDQQVQDEEGLRNIAFCVGYVRGVVESVYTGKILEGTQATKSKFLTLACIPVGVKNTQIMKVVEKYLREHPEELHLAASSLIWAAMHDAFPCKVPAK